MDSFAQLMRDTAGLAPTGPAAEVADPVGESWRLGRRRRLQRGTVAAAGTLAALLAVATLVLGPSRLLTNQSFPASGGHTSGVTAHPQRIGHQLWVRDLGDRAGPIAALIRVEDGGGGQWQALSPTGERSALKESADMWDNYPAVSRDGNRIAYLQTDQNRLVVLDLRTGARWVFADIGGQVSAGPSTGQTERKYQLFQQMPSTFSPSGDAVVLPTSAGTTVLDLTDSSVHVVKGMDQAAGWADDDRLIGRTFDPASDPFDLSEGLTLSEWKRSTGTTTTLGQVRLTGVNTSASLLGQWWGSIRGDGTLWLNLADDGVMRQWVAGLSLADLSPVDLTGQRVPSLTLNEIQPITGGISWQGQAPAAVPDAAGSEFRTVVLGSSLRPTTTSEPSVGLQQIIWAQGALDGDASFSLWGTNAGWWTWWWKEVALGVLTLIALLWWRRRRRPASGVAAAWQSGRRE